METRVLKVLFSKSGSGSINTKVSIPKKWMDEMNVTKEERNIEVILNDDKSITIRKATNQS